MTEEQKILGLVPAKSLGCLDAEDNLFLQSYIEQGLSFPWNEMGKYQQIAALLPLNLQLEVPDPQLKDDVALKLIKITEELRTKELKEEEERLALQKAQEEEQRAKEIQEEEERLALLKAQEEEQRNRELQEEQERLAFQKAQDEELEKYQEEIEQPEEQLEETLPVDENEILPPFNLDDIELPETDSPEPFSLTEKIEEEQQVSTELFDQPLTESQPSEEDFNPSTVETSEDQLSPQLEDETQAEENLFEETNQEEIVAQEQLPDTELTEELENPEESVLSEEQKEEPLNYDLDQEQEPNLNPSTVAPVETVEESESNKEDELEDNRSKFVKFQEEKKKTIEEKMYRALEVDLEEAISSFNKAEKRLTKNLLIAYIAIAVLLALLIFSFFKFTADIKSLENEVKKGSTSQLIDNRNTGTNLFYLS